MLDGILHCNIRLCDCLAERIKIDADEVDRLDAIGLELVHMVLDVAAGQKGSMDFRMKSLYATVADLRETGDVADAGHRHACLFQHFHGAARRENLPSEGNQFFGELYYACLVTYAD